MKINWSPRSFSEQSKEQLFHKFSVPTGARVYVSALQSLFEITRGLTELFLHKRSVAIIQDGSPYWATVSAQLSRQGLSVQIFEYKDIQNTDVWLDKLKKDTLFVAFASEHLFSAEIYNFDVLKEKMHSKKIFTIELSHLPLSGGFNSSLGEYQAQIYLYSNQFALALLGSRVQSIADLYSGSIVFSEEYIKEISSNLEQAANENRLSSHNQSRVEKFEAQLPQYTKAFFTLNASRIYDRAVIRFENIDSFAVQELLEQKTGIKNKIVATSLCRWQGIRTNEWTKWSDEVIRSTLLVPIDCIDKVNSELPAVLQEIAAMAGF